MENNIINNDNNNNSNNNNSIGELLSIPDRPKKKRGLLRLVRTAQLLLKLRGSKDYLWQLLVCGLRELHRHEKNFKQLPPPLDKSPPSIDVNSDDVYKSSATDDAAEQLSSGEEDDDAEEERISADRIDDRAEEFIRNFYEQMRMQRSSSVGPTCQEEAVML